MSALHSDSGAETLAGMVGTGANVCGSVADGNS